MHATNEYGTISNVAKVIIKKSNTLPTVIDASMESHRKASMASGLFKKWGYNFVNGYNDSCLGWHVALKLACTFA